MTSIRAVAAASLWFFLLVAPSYAAGCNASTKIKIASLDVTEADRAVLCAGVGAIWDPAENSLTTSYYSTVVSTGERLRRAGYKSTSMYVELLGLAGARSPSDLDLVAAAYLSSNGCLTPAFVMLDMANAVKNGKKGEASGMFRMWDRESFTTYLAMVGRDNGCSFH